MRELVIKIDMNNAAFGDNRYEEASEAVKIIRNMIFKISTESKIRDSIFSDSNGNIVASMEVIETP